ncbi:MAG: GIY-YIG nuclease family protein [Armatimonadetes bacterium]|nr:GIY-YIG nuclease family protein [Armatimonadota bacterium]
MWMVYILRSTKTGRHYIGFTNDINRRLAEHNGGLNRSTKGRGPWEVVHTEGHGSKEAAVRRELQIKSWKSAPAICRLVDFGRPW